MAEPWYSRLNDKVQKALTGTDPSEGMGVGFPAAAPGADKFSGDVPDVRKKAKPTATPTPKGRKANPRGGSN